MSKPLFSSAISESAFAFVGTRNPSPQEIGELSADIFRTKYRELCAVVDMDELAGRLFAWTRLNAPLDVPLSISDQVAWAETAVYELLERGMIKPLLETPESCADLQKLSAAVGKSGLRATPTVSAPVVEPSAATAVVDPIDECASDFKNLCSSDFRQRWLTPTKRHIYDRAVASGKV